MEGKRFIVRVYGLIHNDWKEVLVAEEFHFNTFMRKFPGGGLEFGEGPADCLFREMNEELNVSLPVGDLLHTTRVFIQSAFNPNHQVLGIYFLVKADDRIKDKFRDQSVMPTENGQEFFRWELVENLSSSNLTFPADQQAYEAFLEIRSKLEKSIQ